MKLQLYFNNMVNQVYGIFRIKNKLKLWNLLISVFNDEGSPPLLRNLSCKSVSAEVRSNISPLTDENQLRGWSRQFGPFSIDAPCILSWIKKKGAINNWLETTQWRLRPLRNRNLKISHSVRLWANFYGFSSAILFFEYQSIFGIRILIFGLGALFSLNR